MSCQCYALLWFHAWWHFFAAFGLYSQLMLIIYYRYDMREMALEKAKWKGVLPTATLKAVLFSNLF